MPVDARTVPPSLYELEAEVMEILWANGESNIRLALEQLNERSSKARKYTTVMTTMVRLVKKGLLVRRRDGRTDFYKPAMSRAEYFEARAAVEVDALVETYGDAALVLFARRINDLDAERALSRGGAAG